MQSGIENAEATKTQRTYARLAGYLFLGVIIVAFGGGFILSHVAGSGSFAETAKRIAASERLYRVGLSAAVIVSLGSALLAFALYATLRPVNSLLAQLAMIFSLGDSFLALVVRMCDFVRLHLYLSTQTVGPWTADAQSLSDLMRSIGSITENIGGISFGIGSLLFFCLFFKSKYIPRILSGLGVAAAVIWVSVYFANLVFPERHALFMVICFPPMALADVLTGFYLMLFTVKTEVDV
ncbi:DUF4386 domain-containing protein [Alloacidobacterium sp.]|uniref:DUF4386 domain-containing protein n=1 Tax=Alloacidobacterium sp. TaxID=2951999 RepID=UPI002D653D2A|nr:DUF4386 domain-containing protein [Alloacidobacterium sp.]HYK34387.1 DUF4386 domain-containing protein [Alloacidobacterium sp.]